MGFGAYIVTGCGQYGLGLRLPKFTTLPNAAPAGFSDFTPKTDNKWYSGANVFAYESFVSSAIATHEAASDPHTGYQKESEKGAASGYAGLDAGTKVPTAQLGSGSASSSTFLAGDQTYKSIASGAWTPVDKTADQTKNTDTTLAADTHLKFPMLAGNTYEFIAEIWFDTDTAAGFDWRHVGTQAADRLRITRYTIGCGNTVLANILTDVAYSAADISVPGSTSTGGFILMKGIIDQGKSDGDFEFHWAQGTSKGTNTTVLKGSRIFWRLKP